MNILKTIFDKMAFPLNVWKLSEDDSDADCIYSNNRLFILENGTKYNIYYTQYYKNCSVEYQIFFKTKKSITFETTRDSVYMEFVDDELFYEIHYPKSHTDYILSSVSFKIRNPLTNIVGIIGIMEKKGNSEVESHAIYNYMNILKKSSADIIKVANDIIDLLNIKQNKVIIIKEEVYLEKLVRDCLHLVSKDAKKKKINLGFKIDKNLPKILYTDKDRLKQILINLLDNSIANIDVGSVTIDITVNTETKPFPLKDVQYPQHNILFKIRDTGIGIDEDKKNMLESILDIYDKNSDSMKSNKLTGFGIYISKHLCNLLNGHMWFKSEKDVGTVFYFNIIC